MRSLSIKFNESTDDAVSNEDHFAACLEKSRDVLEKVGHIADERPDDLKLRLECPTLEIETVVKFLTTETKLGIAKVIPLENGDHMEIGGEGGNA